MTDNEWIPLGSVVVLKGTTQKLLIIGRGLNVGDEGSEYYFDYCGVAYPEGLMSDQVVYFNHTAVYRTLYAGYDDDDNRIMNDRINSYISDHPDLKRMPDQQNV